MKKILLSAVTSLAIAVIPASAFACDFTVKGSGACQTDGSFNINWIVNNSDVNQSMNITYSSNPSVVKAGSIIPAKTSSTFAQNKVDGTKAGSYKLELIGKWQGINTQQDHSATVSLAKACTQPVVVTPPVIKSDSVSVATSTPVIPAPAPAVAAQVVVAPKGAVNAGSVGNDSKLASALGLSSSVGILGLGIRRLAKSGR